jgi:hypothetical protein
MQFQRRNIMTSLFSDSNEAAQRLPPVRSNDILRGILVGLIPLGLLVVVIAIVLLLTPLVRQLTAPSGFFVQQQAVLFVVIPGLVLAVVMYAVAAWLTLRHIAAWQQEGAVRRANSALWALVVTAFIVILPVVLAIVLP